MKKLILAVVLASFGLFFGAGAENAEAQDAALFTFNETPKALPAGEKYSVASIKEAGITIDLAELSRANAAKLNFPLFDGKTYRAQREEIEIRSLTDLTWRGKIREGKFVGDCDTDSQNAMLPALFIRPARFTRSCPAATGKYSSSSTSACSRNAPGI